MAHNQIFADLEIGLRRHDEGSYDLDLRFSQPDSDADIRLEKQASNIKLDVKALRRHHLNDVDYGQTLAAQLFEHPKVLEAFNLARSNARSQDVPLRVRLFIDPGAVELHSLRWETLRDPDAPDSTLLTSDLYYFSRYLSSFDWQPVRPQAKSELKALVVIANPDDLDPKQLAPVDVAGELARAQGGLDQIKMTVLARPEGFQKPFGSELAGRPTLQHIQDHLRQGYDILYLVCHGALEGSDPLLWLEQETGEADVVSGRDLVTRLQELQQRPRLVVLASCQSAGGGDQQRSSDGGALAALGPRLAEIGIPAVLAMQGNISMKTVEQFMPTFFATLQKDGQIDRAMAMARGAVRERPDWWMPVLFMRLKSGRLWYAPGYADDKDGLKKWNALLNNLKRGRVTPILGPDLTESLFGSRQALARRWAEVEHFPMAPHDREDLPQVAQFLAVNNDDMYPRDKLLDYVKEELLKRYGHKIASDFQEAELNKLLAEVGRLRREQNPADPYRVLAELELPIYITTNPGNFLEEALRAADKEPVVEICRWNEDIQWLPSIYDEGKEPDYRPTPQRPLVYQLFGKLDEPDSLVLTEDNYFDFLIGATKNDELIPPIVRRKWVDTALLFLGFRLDDWNFRVLFRTIMSRGGQKRSKKYAHVAVQIDPEEGRILEPERARRYLESYFQGADISIYWGSAEDFIKELKEKLG